MARRPEPEDEETSVYDSANQRPKSDTTRGHDVATRIENRASDAATRQMKPPRVEPPIGTVSEEIRLISMKTPGEIVEKQPEADPRVVKLRGISEFHTTTPPRGLGRLAPPRDEAEVRTRRRKDLVMWSVVVLVIGALVMTIVVLLARR